MAKQGATPLSESEFVDEVLKRLDGMSKADVRKVLSAIKAEVVDCVSSGYRVTLSGLVSFTPRSKPGRAKGTVVRNPFDGSEKKLRSDEPDKFVVKAKASSSIASAFPSVKSKDGQELIKRLAPPKKKAPAKAKAKKGK